MKYHSLYREQLILTSTRQEQALVRSFLHAKSRKKTFQVVQIYDWIKEIVKEYLEESQSKTKVLKEASAQLIWHQIIRNYFYKKNQENQTFDIGYSEFSRSIVQQAMNAYKTLIQWNIPADYFDREENRLYVTPSTNTFLEWQTQFETLCQNKNWLVVYKMVWQVGDWIKSGTIQLPEVIYYNGFDAITPQTQMLFDILKEHCEFKPFVITMEKNKENIEETNLNKKLIKDYYKFSDISTEFYSIAEWARQKYEENHDIFASQKLKPRFCPIGIVLDNLQENQTEIKETFNQVFIHHQDSQPFNIELSESLSSLEIIKQMLFLLGLNRYKLLSLSQMNYLMLNIPYDSVGEIESLDEENHENSSNLTEFEKRLTFDAYLREKFQNKTKYSLRDFYFEINSIEKNESPNQRLHIDSKNLTVFSNLISRFFELYDEFQSSELHSAKEWYQYFNALLNLWGWFDQLDKASEQYSHLEDNRLKLHIETLFKQYLNASEIFEKISLSDSLTLLKNLADDYALRSKSSKSPIKILSTMESQIYDYDYLWLVDAHAQNYPDVPHPNHFLPLDLQQKYDMPRATTENQYQFSFKLFETWMNQTQKEFNISFIEHHKQEELRPSSLILNQINKKYHDVSYYPKKLNYTEYIATLRNHLEKQYASPFQWKENSFYNQDVNAPKLNEEELKKVQGGTFIFKNQANCPFSAFAVHRLKLQELNMPEDGIYSKERGTLTHKCLELLWKKIQNLSHLKEIMSEEYLSTFQQYFDEAFAEILKDKQGNIYYLEKSRIKDLVIAWLNYETQRNLEFKIYELEKKYTINIGNIHASVQLDRIDYYPSLDSYLIIDYKSTSAGDIKNWNPKRIKEPQMPIYAIALDKENKNLAGATFANVNLYESKFNGRFDVSFNARLNKNLTSAEKQSIIDPIPNLPKQRREKEGYKDTMKEYVEIWKKDLIDLAEEFSNGIAFPMPNDNACKYCSYGALCRVKKYSKEY